MSVLKQLKYESVSTLLTTELNSLANNSRAISAAQGGDTSDAHLLADFELVCTFGTAPTLDNPVHLYLVRAADGTNYEDGDGSVRPAQSACVGSFYVRNVTSAQRMVIRDVPLPPGLYKAIIENKSGQAMAASGNTLKIRPHNLQSV